MQTLPSHLRPVLLWDAVTCAASGLLLTIAAGMLGPLVQISSDLLLYAGLVLLVCAAFIATVATRPIIPALGVWVIIVGNVLWVVGSLALPAARLIAPNILGLVFVVAQAMVVAVLAGLEYRALRGPRAATSAG